MNVSYEGCLVCNSSNIVFALTAKDFTVSQEKFRIFQCNACTFRFTQNIPPAEGIGKYYQSENYISHTETEKGLVNRLYHFVRKITLKSKISLIKQHTKLVQGSLLDIGAGTGAFAHGIQAAGWKCTGIEPDESARTIAAEKYSVSLSDQQQLFKLPEHSFDAITLWHVLEHVHKLDEYMIHIKRLLKESGKIFIAVPNYTSYDAKVYQQFWAAYDVPRHLYHFSPKSMKSLLEGHNLKLQAVLPMWFDSYYVSLLSEKYKTGKQNIVKSFFNGSISNLKAIFNTEKCSSVIYVISN
ncbi:class I SAM-dependent methyltransferase [soil metagenome]